MTYKACLNILLVEDDPVCTQLIIDTLIACGHSITLATTGQDALRTLAQQTPYDLIYLDINLPSPPDTPPISGIDVCRIARETSHPTKPNQPLGANAWIVAVSTLTDVLTVREMLACGANDYLTKPFTPTILTIKTLVCQYALARQQPTPPNLNHA